MAIVVLVLWIFTAGAGVYLLVTSGLGQARSARPAAPGPPSARAAAQPVSAAAAAGASRREQRRAARQQFDPPSLVAARNAPMLPEPRSLLEFGHPAFSLIGLGFWVGYTLVHARVLAWIAFGLVAATACAGLAWLAANIRGARRRRSGEPGPSFAGRVAVMHGGAAAVTVTLAAVTAFVAR